MDIISLKNWKMLEVPQPENTPPELMITLIGGNVYNHPKHEDGKLVTTSRIVNVDKENKTITTHSGSVYAISKEDICSEYEEAYPNAYERIFALNEKRILCARACKYRKVCSLHVLLLWGI